MGHGTGNKRCLPRSEVGRLKAQDQLETVVEKVIFRGSLMDVNGSVLK